MSSFLGGETEAIVLSPSTGPACRRLFRGDLRRVGFELGIEIAGFLPAHHVERYPLMRRQPFW
jgi:hypothetical protein